MEMSGLNQESCKHKHRGVSLYAYRELWRYMNPKNQCSNSRLQGCRGCRCRYPMPTNEGQCEQCNRGFFELDDELFDVRRKIYTVAKFREYLVEDSEFEALEWHINCLMWMRVNWHTLPEMMPRAACLNYFKHLTTQVTQQVISRVFYWHAKCLIADYKKIERPHRFWHP